jgi:adenosylhomocysteinase
MIRPATLHFEDTRKIMDHKEGAYKVRDLSLADAGRLRIEWAESRMPVLMRLRERYSTSRPFDGYKITGCLHVTKETAVLVETFAACGAEVSWSGCNPLSTNDEVSAALARAGIEIYAWHGQNVEEFYWSIDRTIDKPPHLTLDDGADLIFRVHNKFPEMSVHIIGGSEETTTGVHRLRAMAADGKLLYPVYAVNDAETKWDFDNVYGTGQSTLDGILRASSVLLAGKNFVVAGYGHCGRGVAMRARGMGANVIVTEVKATAALKATLEGCRVMTMEEAAEVGDIFVTATGMKDVIRGNHFVKMKEGAVVCNTGHYDVELNLKELAELCTDARLVRDGNREYTLENGKRIFVLADGRLVNLAAAEGHPSEVMDMSFANQFNAHLNLVEAYERGDVFENAVIDLPVELDQEIAGIKLETMGLSIDLLTDEQVAYATDYSAGT